MGMCARARQGRYVQTEYSAGRIDKISQIPRNRKHGHHSSPTYPSSFPARSTLLFNHHPFAHPLPPLLQPPMQLPIIPNTLVDICDSSLITPLINQPPRFCNSNLSMRWLFSRALWSRRTARRWNFCAAENTREESPGVEERTDGRNMGTVPRAA